MYVLGLDWEWARSLEFYMVFGFDSCVYCVYITTTRNLSAIYFTIVQNASPIFVYVISRFLWEELDFGIGFVTMYVLIVHVPLSRCWESNSWCVLFKEISWLLTCTDLNLFDVAQKGIAFDPVWNGKTECHVLLSLKHSLMYIYLRCTL